MLADRIVNCLTVTNSEDSELTRLHDDLVDTAERPDTILPHSPQFSLERFTRMRIVAESSERASHPA